MLIYYFKAGCLEVIGQVYYDKEIRKVSVPKLCGCYWVGGRGEWRLI